VEGQGAGLCGGRSRSGAPVRCARGEARAATGRGCRLRAGQSRLWPSPGSRRHRGRGAQRRRQGRDRAIDSARSEGAVQMSELARSRRAPGRVGQMFSIIGVFLVLAPPVSGGVYMLMQTAMAAYEGLSAKDVAMIGVWSVLFGAPMGYITH